MPVFTDTLALIGANRGAREVVAVLLDGAAPPPRSMLVADPKPGRAGSISDLLGRHGVRAEGYQRPGEAVLAGLDPQVPAVVAIDDVGALATLAQTEGARPVLAQGVAQGGADAAGSEVTFGVQLALGPARPDRQAEGRELLQVLARTAPPQSSQRLRSSAVDAFDLFGARRAVSRETVGRLRRLDGLFDDEHPSSLLWHDEVVPLSVVRSDERDARTRRELVLDTARRHGLTAVGLHDGRTELEFALVEPNRRRGGSFVRAWVPFGRLPPLPPPGLTRNEVLLRRVVTGAAFVAGAAVGGTAEFFSSSAWTD